ncbi:MAG: UPF0182 family protein [Actinomycetota bacterium]
MARVPRVTRQRPWLVIVVGAVVILVVVLTALSGFFVDLLWFREVGFSQVFWTVLRTKILLGVLFAVVFFAILYANLFIVRLITPRQRPLLPDQQLVERYRLAIEPRARWLLPLVAAVIAVVVGLGMATQWRAFLMWRNASGVSFGTLDPQFNRDPAYYVFSLPWLEVVQGWLFSSLVGVTIITAVAHVLWGGIRPQAPGLGEKVTPQVKAHLSVLLGLIVLTKAWGYYLGTFDLLTSPRGVVTGASYTDVNAQLPALRILIFIAVACAILFLVNIRMRGWALPVIAVGLLALASVTAGTLYPAFVQRFRVAPQELQKERPYIERNIEATRAAFGLATIDAQRHSLAAEVTAQDVKGNETTVGNIRLWRPDVLKESFKSLQRIRQFFEFEDIDVDRYVLSGERRVVMISAREVSQRGIPGGGGTWQNTHLVYTHGLGAVAAQVNTATAEGAPRFTVSDIPPSGEPQMTANGQRVYYGEVSDVSFVVANTEAEELDYQSAELGTETPGAGETGTSAGPYLYSGTGGIPMGGFFQRLLFAWHFRDVNLLISSLIDGDSRIMIFRDIQSRIPKVAPFLEYDGDPYAAIVDGRIVWIQDAYTTTSRYPYSQEVDLAGPTQGKLTGVSNYIRNSVKVVVDAYNGSMTFYDVSNGSDPILRVWENAFPDLFTPMSEASADLVAHFRYPEDLFRVQADRYANYHVTDPDVFYQKQDFWQVPNDPTIREGDQPMRPYYVLMRLPGETSESFQLILPFTPQGRQNIVAWMAANSDPGSDYGRVVSYLFPSGVNVDGPSQVFARINQDPAFSEQRTLLGQTGSEVLFGDFLVIPINNGLLYVQPVYVRSAQENAIPELKYVLAVNGGTVGLGGNLKTALANSFGVQVTPPGEDGGGGAPGGSIQQRIQRLLKSAQEHFANADEALKAGDLATYQAEINAAEADIAKAAELAARLTGGESGATPTPPPSAASPTLSPTPSPTG